MADIEQAKLELIEKTNMVDYAVDIYQNLNQTDEVSILLFNFETGWAAWCTTQDEHLWPSKVAKSHVNGVPACTSCLPGAGVSHAAARGGGGAAEDSGGAGAEGWEGCVAWGGRVGWWGRPSGWQQEAAIYW